MTTVGVLAIQGDFAEHRMALESLGVEVKEIRLPDQLDDVDGLIVPGGESTTIVQLIDIYEMREKLREADPGRPDAHLGHLRRNDRHGWRVNRSPANSSQPDGHGRQSKRLRSPGRQLRVRPRSGWHGRSALQGSVYQGSCVCLSWGQCRSTCEPRRWTTGRSTTRATCWPQRSTPS